MAKPRICSTCGREFGARVKPYKVIGAGTLIDDVEINTLRTDHLVCEECWRAIDKAVSTYRERQEAGFDFGFR